MNPHGSFDTAWHELAIFFEHDEGYFLELELRGTVEDVRQAWRLLNAAGAVDLETPVWHIAARKEVPLREVPDPVGAVAGDEVEPFYLPLRVLKDEAVSLPDLGCHVVGDLLILSYAPGDGWGPAQVRILCRALSSLRTRAPGLRILPDRILTPEMQERFRRGLRLAGVDCG